MPCSAPAHLVNLKKSCLCLNRPGWSTESTKKNLSNSMDRQHVASMVRVLFPAEVSNVTKLRDLIPTDFENPMQCSTALITVCSMVRIFFLREISNATHLRVLIPTDFDNLIQCSTSLYHVEISFPTEVLNVTKLSHYSYRFYEYATASITMICNILRFLFLQKFRMQQS